MLQKRAPRPGRSVRIGTWNVRWFPDGAPGKRAKGPGTDLEWLACAVNLLDIDVLAVQEFKAHHAAREKLERLMELLNRRGARFSYRLDDCPRNATQHVGFLFNQSRATLVKLASIAELNPRGAACKDSLRPGLAAEFRFSGGLDAWLVTLHLKSGTRPRDRELRRRSLNALAQLMSDPRRADTDVVVLGDFNTQGCPKCSTALKPGAELADAEALLGGVGLRRVPNPLGCSEYYRGSSSNLDHVFVSRGTRELDDATVVSPGGLCQERSCQALEYREAPAMLRSVSDHCPLYFDLEDRDLD